MKAPVKFVQDGPESQTQIRQCGVPIQYRLSDAMGEAALFCLDFAVNNSTESNLYRLHDDIWFWGSSYASWETILEFASVLGLTLNEGKTGAAKIPSNSDVLQETSLLNGLPQGEVRWGCLKLGSSEKWTSMTTKSRHTSASSNSNKRRAKVSSLGSKRGTSMLHASSRTTSEKPQTASGALIWIW